MNNKGKYIVLEGPDLVGKSTMAQMVSGWLKSKDIKSIVAPQPGATDLGEKIRAIVKHDRGITLGQETEALMFVLDHMSFVETVLSKKLDEGIWVISDRHNFISALVYQVLNGVNPYRLEQFYSIFECCPRADMLLLLSATKQELKNRAPNRPQTWDRYENNNDFMDKVVDAYENLTSTHGRRINDIVVKNIDVSPIYHIESGEINNVFENIITLISNLLIDDVNC